MARLLPVTTIRDTLEGQHTPAPPARCGLARRNGEVGFGGRRTRRSARGQWASSPAVSANRRIGWWGLRHARRHIRSILWRVGRRSLRAKIAAYGGPPPEEDSGIRNSPEKNLRPDCQISALLCISPRFWATIAVGMVARNEGPSPAGRCCHVASVPTGLKRQASGKRRS